MKRVEVEPGITIGLEYMPDDVEVCVLTDEKLIGLLRVAVISGLVMGAVVITVGMTIRMALMVWG